jgi:hypothetical protein
MAKTSASATVAVTEQSTGREIATESVDRGLATWNKEAHLALNNFDGDERQQFALRMLCMSASSAGETSLNLPIPVKYWMVHEVDFENEETGETVRTFRTVLVTPERATYAFVSQGVARSVQAIYEQFGNKPLDPPMLLKVEQKTTSKRRRLYVLVPAEAT